MFFFHHKQYRKQYRNPLHITIFFKNKKRNIKDDTFRKLLVQGYFDSFYAFAAVQQIVKISCHENIDPIKYFLDYKHYLYFFVML